MKDENGVDDYIFVPLFLVGVIVIATLICVFGSGK
jgi:hypothetical protein